MIRGGRGNREWGGISRKKFLSENKRLLRMNHKNTISKGHFFVGHPVRSASFADKVPIVMVYERLEVSINVTIMISTIGMVHELPFYVNIQTFFTQTFLDKDL